jgi:hypothetical protein
VAQDDRCSAEEPVDAADVAQVSGQLGRVETRLIHQLALRRPRERKREWSFAADD